MHAQPIAYPKLAGELVESLNALSLSGEIPLPHAGVVRSCPSRGAYAARLTLGVTVGGSPLRVHLDAGAMETVLGDIIPNEVFETLDEDLQAAVLETALAEPLAAMAEVLRADVVLEGVPVTDAGAPRDPAGARAELPFEVRGTGGIARCTVLVEPLGPLPPAVLEALAQFRQPRDCGELPFPVTFELGHAALSEADLRSLEPGDIVLFDRCYFTEERLRVNVCEAVSLIGTLAGFDLTIAETGD